MSVSVSGIGVTRPNLHFSQYIQAYKPFADHVPPNIKQYQLILTKYQPVSSYTDPVLSSTTYDSSSRKEQFSQQNNFSFTTHLMCKGSSKNPLKRVISEAKNLYRSRIKNLKSQSNRDKRKRIFQGCSQSPSKALANIAKGTMDPRVEAFHKSNCF